MPLFSTLIYARCPIDGTLKQYGGPDIDAPNKQLAFEYCQNNGLGYCHVSDEVVAIIPCDDNYKPMFDKMVDFEVIKSN